MEEYESSDGVATREFKRLRNIIRTNCTEISKQSKEIGVLKKLLAECATTMKRTHVTTGLPELKTRRTKILKTLNDLSKEQVK